MLPLSNAVNSVVTLVLSGSSGLYAQLTGGAVHSAVALDAAQAAASALVSELPSSSLRSDILAQLEIAKIELEEDKLDKAQAALARASTGLREINGGEHFQLARKRVNEEQLEKQKQAICIDRAYQFLKTGNLQFVADPAKKTPQTNLERALLLAGVEAESSEKQAEVLVHSAFHMLQFLPRRSVYGFRLIPENPEEASWLDEKDYHEAIKIGALFLLYSQALVELLEKAPKSVLSNFASQHFWDLFNYFCVAESGDVIALSLQQYFPNEFRAKQSLFEKALFVKGLVREIHVFKEETSRYFDEEGPFPRGFGARKKYDPLQKITIYRGDETVHFYHFHFTTGLWVYRSTPIRIGKPGLIGNKAKDMEQIADTAKVLQSLILNAPELVTKEMLILGDQYIERWGVPKNVRELYRGAKQYLKGARPNLFS